MSRLKGWFLRVKRAANPKAFEAQMAEEMRQHLEMEAAAHRAAGEDELTARRAAAVDFGPAEVYKEEIRDRRLSRPFAEMRLDARQALRLMRRHPGFSIAVIVTIGIAIGLNTAIFAAAKSSRTGKAWPAMNNDMVKPIPASAPAPASCRHE